MVPASSDRAKTRINLDMLSVSNLFSLTDMIFRDPQLGIDLYRYHLTVQAYTAIKSLH